MPSDPPLSVQRGLRALVALLLVLGAAQAQAGTCSVCSTTGSGLWSDPAAWGGSPPASNGAVVTINNGHTITLTTNSQLKGLTVNAGGVLQGTVGSTYTITMASGSAAMTINGRLDFQAQSAGATVATGHLLLGANTDFSGSGTLNLYSWDLNNKSLTFLSSPTATVNLGAPTPILNGTITSPTGMSWDFNALGNQTIPTTGFTWANLAVSGSGSKTIASGTLAYTGGLTIGAGTTLDGATNNPTVNITGNVTDNGTLNAGTGNWTFNGASAQLLSGSAAGTTFGKLIVNNSAGLTVQHNVTATTLLTLTSGKVVTSGAGVEVIASASCVTGVTRTSGYVAGVLRKTVPAGSPTCAYEIGDASTYRPLTSVAFTSVTTPFAVSAGISQAAGDHPQIASSGINPNKSVNRYWTLTNYGPGSPFTSYALLLPFLTGDVDAGAATGSFIASRYAASAWTRATVSSAGASSTQLTGLTGFGDFALGELAVDHYEISLPSSSLACLASSVTITACLDSSSPCSNPSGSINGSTASLATSAGTLGATSITFNGLGVATTTLSYAAATNGAVATVTLSGESIAGANARQCCPNGASCVAANSCSSTFNTAAFIFASSAGGASTTLPTQTAGTASASYTLRAVKSNTTTQACETAISGVSSVNWAYQCNNPTTCSAGNLLALTGNAATSIAANPNTGVTSTTAVAMTFDANGNAPFSFNYADVGQITLSASKAAGGALLTALSGSSNAFVVKPAGFALSTIQQTASPFLANPAAASAAGAKFVKAGESFSATVTALNSGGAATPNFGRETTPEGVLLTPALVLPAGGVAGTLANASIAGASFASGVATLTNLAYSEVGILTLTPSVASASYLGAGNVVGTTSANIGRVFPSQFALTTGTPLPACSASFTYFGQDGFTTPFTLTAKNTAGATTQNYVGSFAKLGLSSWSNFGFSSASLPSGAALAASATAPSGSWTLGAAAVMALHQVSRPSSLAGETSIVVKAAPVDSDGVGLSATAVGAGTPLRWGRLRLSNAYGSATAALQVPVVAEYWSANSWVLNSADSCSTLAAGNVVLSNPRTATGSTSTATSTASATALASGSGLITLSAPSPAGSSLSLDLAINLGSTTTDQSCQANHPASTGAAKPWLRAQNGSCAATTDRDPSARASFGIYSPETRKTVHVREIF